MSNKVGISFLILALTIALWVRINPKKYMFNNFDANLEKYPLIYENNFFDSNALEKLDQIVKSRNVSIIFDDPGVESAGEAKPIDDPDCKHPFLISKGNSTYCAFPSRIDIGIHYLKTGGFENRMEKYETMAARVMTFRHKFLDELKEDRLKEIYGDKFLQKAKDLCHQNDPVNYKSDKLTTGLFQFDVILMLPGQELPMHLDIPYFWGADRKNIPHWLLVLMKQSGLFEDKFIPQVQGVSWLSKHQYNKLELESLKNGGNFYFYPYKDERQKYVLAKSDYNSALLVDGTQVVHGVERFKAETEQPPLEKNNHYYLSYEKDTDQWGLFNSLGHQLKRYNNDDLRVSLVWRVHCFKDQNENEKYKNQTDRVPIEEVLDVFRNDLKKRNIQVDENVKMLEFLIQLIDEYSNYPNKKSNGLPIFNYCLLPILLPKSINDYFLKYIFDLIC